MEDILEIEEASKFLHCCVQTLRSKIRRKEIPVRYIGGKYIFSKTALTLWLSGVDSETIVSSLLRRENKWKI